MKVLETPNGTQRRTGNPCLQHSSGLLQAVCAHIRAVPASLKFTLGCWGARCSGGNTLHRWPVSPAWPWGCCSSLQLLPLTNTTYRLLLWIIPVPPATDHPWLAQAPPHSSSHPSSSHPSSRHGTYGPQARESKQNQAALSKGRQKTATIAPGLEQNCHLLPQKSQNRSQPGAGKNNILS